MYTNKHKHPFEIDDEDYELISQYHWYRDREGYIKCPHIRVKDAKRRTSWKVHRLLLGKAPPGYIWDHKDQDKSNNHRENLRLVTHTISERNKGLQKNTAFGIRGVTHTPWNKWKATLRIPGKRFQLYFDTFEEAVAKRLALEREYWGNER